jgi:hypothetical protein
MVARYRPWRRGLAGMWRWRVAMRYNIGGSIENIIDIFERGGIVVSAKALGALGFIFTDCAKNP